ncbi:MAG: amino acid adenylation domain-containing protein [Cyanobacteria bacterium J06623_4]
MSQTTAIENPQSGAASGDDVFVLPASFSQQRLWLVDQMQGQSSAYNMSMVLLLKGELNVAALERSLHEIIQRHEALRTNFQMVDDSLMQVIAESVNFSLETVSVEVEGKLLPLPPQVKQAIAQETKQPFNLKNDALIRTKLLKIQETQNVLVVTMHHIITDGWSQNLFKRELTQIYSAFSAGKASPLPPLSIQYADFALWQQEMLSGEKLQSHLHYWKNQLAGSAPLIKLPTDFARPDVKTSNGDTVRFRLTPALTARIKEISQQVQATPFITLLTAFNILLFRYSGLEDIVVGSPIANRQRKELEPIIGCFVNTLVFRTQLRSDISFLDLLTQVRRTALDAYAHQDLPFEKLVGELQPERCLSHTPLFQVAFVVHNMPKPGKQSSGLKISRLAQSSAVSKFDLSLVISDVKDPTQRQQGRADSVSQSGDGQKAGAKPNGRIFTGRFIYSTDLFKAETIERLATQFEALLEDISRSPTQAIGNLSLLTQKEQHQAAQTRTVQNKILTLSPAKRALLEKRLRQKQSAASGVDLTAHTLTDKHADKKSLPGSDALPTDAQPSHSSTKSPIQSWRDSSQSQTDEFSDCLSFNQQSLWLLDQLAPGDPAFNRPANVSFTGKLNLSALQQTLSEIIYRHESLRTYFVTSSDGQPQQQFAPVSVPFSMPVQDLSSLPPDQQKAEAQRLAIAQSQHPFDLSSPLLLRTILLKLSDSEHILLLTFHHIIFDGWSMGVLLQEIKQLYGAFSAGQPSPLAPLPIQYADFAQWQRQQFREGHLSGQLAYWTQQLSGHLPILELPSDRPRTAQQKAKHADYQSAEHTLQISKPLKAQLSHFGQQSQATLFMVLLAGFKTLLYRYTQAEDIIVATPVAGRNQVETEDLIGLFFNTLLLRSHPSSQQSFTTFLAHIRDVSLAAFSHQNVPLMKLIEHLRQTQSLEQRSLFQVLFQYKNFPGKTVSVNGVEIDECQLGTGRTNLDLTLEITEQTNGLLCTFRYDTALFDTETIQRFGTHFQALLQGIVQDPTQSLSQLPLLPTAEKQQLLDWSRNDAAASSMTETAADCIHTLFEQQVARTPQAIALSAGPHTITYQALNNRANQVAHTLLANGLTPDTLVGVMIERSVDMVVALLGILKAGGAYLPLDPTYPAERLAFMAQDADLSFLLTQTGCKPLLPEPVRSTFCLDGDWSAIAQQPDWNPHLPLTKHQLAYVIYTSGSTGTPKGVMVEHRSLVNFTRVSVDGYGVGKRDRILQFASLSFDAAAEEIFPALTSGATLVLRPEGMLSPLSTFLDTCQQLQLTVLDLPTAYWQQLVSELTVEKLTLPPSLRLVIIGGERVSPESVATWLTQVGNMPRLVNTYGPTEATVVATAHPITAATPGEIPIGTPLQNVHTYVLDPHGNLSPVGIPGELHIGGAALARGYLNQPILTAQKFVVPPTSVPLSSLPSDRRLYKTGDLARYMPSGQLEFLGRIDHQVKIRGFRVELGEIETALQQLDWVKEAVVDCHTDRAGSGTQRLIAYLTVTPEIAPSAPLPDWRTVLRAQLPDYMLPAACRVLPRLPLTPNGKLDRKQLPEPDFSQLSGNSEYQAPQTTTEQKLAELWCSVLGIENIGIHDDFFELGGHSLLAVQLFSKVEKVFGKKLPLATLFQATTISTLAAVLEEDGWRAPWDSLVAIKPQGSRPPLFYLHAGGGNLLVYRELAFSLGEEQPVYGLQPRGLDGSLMPSTDIQEMATFYISQIKTLQPQGPYYFAGLSTGGLIAWEMAQQLTRAGESVALLALFDTGGPDFPKILPIMPRIFSVLSWFVRDTLERIERGWPQMLETLKREGLGATLRQLRTKLNLAKPTQHQPDSATSPSISGTPRSTAKSAEIHSAVGNSPADIVHPDTADRKAIADLLTRRFNLTLTRYRQQTNGHSRLEVAVNLLLAKLLRRSSQTYYANFFTRGLFRQAKRIQSARVARRRELPQALRQVEAANRQAKKQYEPKPYAGKATLFRATERVPGICPDPELGWHGMAGQGMEIYEISGSHSSIIDSPRLVKCLKNCLERAHLESSDKNS